MEILTESDTMLEMQSGVRVEIDLGCGKGALATWLAKEHQDWSVIAVDVMLERLRKISARKEREGIPNLRVIRSEAGHLVGRALPDQSVDRIHLLCPDPWPKLRHKGHRVLSSEFAGLLWRILKPDGVFHFPTDRSAYFQHGCRVMELSGLFRRDDTRVEDVSSFKTEFERLWNGKGIEVAHGGWQLLNG